MSQAPAPPPFSQLMDTAATLTGAAVSFHDVAGVCLTVPWLQLRADQHYHQGPYCSFAKQSGNQFACSQNKDRTLRLARRGRAFAGCCPFGVWDHVQPVMFGERFVGAFYLGSYAGETPLLHINGKAYAGPELQQLNDDRRRACAQYGRHLAEHMTLLLEQWRLDGNELGKRKDASYYAAACHAFIQSRYTDDIALQDLADQLGVHPNHLGVCIRNETGATFRQHLMRHRISHAKLILRQSREPNITQVAYRCGFLDSNYFSTAFKKQTGQTPRQYRRGQ